MKTSRIHCMSKQKGVALTIALLLMILLTALATTNLFNSALGRKMALSYQIQTQNQQLTITAIDEYLAYVASLNTNPLKQNQFIDYVLMPQSQIYVRSTPLTTKMQSMDCQYAYPKVHNQLCFYHLIHAVKYQGVINAIMPFQPERVTYQTSKVVAVQL